MHASKLFTSCNCTNDHGYVALVVCTNDHGYVALVVNTSRSFPHFMTYHRICNQINTTGAIVEQALLTIPEHLSSAPVFSGVRVTRSLCVMFCRLLLVLFCHCVVSYLRFTDSDYPVGILDLRILITPLVSQIYGF